MIGVSVFIFWMTVVVTLPGTQVHVPVGPFKDMISCSVAHDLVVSQMKRMDTNERGSLTIGVLGGCLMVPDFPGVMIDVGAKP